MKIFLKILFMIAILCNAQVTLATPQSDANYIVQRIYDPDALKPVQRQIRESFVAAYFRPLSEFGIEIRDHDRFIDMIPDEDVDPLIDRFLSQSVESYLLIYEPEKLALMAAILRANEDASPEEIFSEEYKRKSLIALEQARARAEPSGLDDPLVIALEELVVSLDALTTMFEGDGAEELAQHFAAGFAHVFTLIGYDQEIQRLHRDLDNPFTIKVLEADGVLEFANPVQRQSLLRQLSDPEDTGGIQFIKPPARDADSN